MKKTLRLALICLLSMVCGTMFADDITIQASQLEGYEGNDGVTVHGITFKAVKNTGSNAPFVYTSKDTPPVIEARMYAKNSLTVKVSSGTITKLVFNLSAQGLKRLAPITASTGSISEQKSGDETVTWTGDAAEVTLTVGDKAKYGSDGDTKAGQLDYLSVVVTTDGSGTTVTVPAPTITGTTPFEGSTEVTLTVPEGGSTKYTTDGSDPADGTVYSAPFTITETTTVKAISYDADGNASAVSSKTFEKTETNSAADIAALLAFEDGTQNINLTLTNAQVLGAGNKNFVIKDATGSVLIYDSKLTWTKGQVLNGTLSCEITTYNGLREIKTLANVEVTATDGTVTATTATPEEVIAAGYLANVFKMENVELTLDNGRYYITVGENKIQVYDNFKYNFSIAAAGKYNLTGILGAYNKVPYQFWLTEAPEAASQIEIGAADDIADLLANDLDKLYTLTLTNAQVLYAWTSNNGNIQAYVRDASGAICMDFRNNNTPGAKFETNKIVNGTIVVSNKQYNGNPQAQSVPEQTTDENLTFTDGDEAQPVKITEADAANYLNDLVLLENVTIAKGEGDNASKYYIGGIQLYNGLKIDDFNSFEGYLGEKNVKGILIVYQRNAEDTPLYELYPIAITEATGINNVESTKADAAIYNVAGQRVNKAVKGVYIQNGKKFVVK